jgi:hypothetical protein
MLWAKIFRPASARVTEPSTEMEKRLDELLPMVLLMGVARPGPCDAAATHRGDCAARAVSAPGSASGTCAPAGTAAIDRGQVHRLQRRELDRLSSRGTVPDPLRAVAR